MGRRERREDRERERERTPSPEIIEKKKASKTVEKIEEVRATSKQPPKSRVEVHQPTTEVWDYENHWQKGFSDCCDDCGICACAFFCTPCFMGKLMRRTGECCCLCACPGGLMSVRTKLRTGFRIKGSIFKDCMAVTFCSVCAAIQMTQELDKQEL